MNHRWIYLILPVLLLLAPFAAAQEPDIYMEEKFETPAMGNQPAVNGIMKTWISGDKLRKQDPTGGQIIIYRGDLGKVYIVSPLQKAYVEMPMAEITRIAEQTLQMYVPSTGQQELYKPTGKTKQIGKWSTSEVEVVSGQSMPGIESKTTMWVAKGSSFEKSVLRRIFETSLGKNFSPQVTKMLDKLSALEGYPVQMTTTTTAQGKTYTSMVTLLKMEKQKVDPAKFEIPDDYTKVVAPPRYPGQ